MGTAAPERRTSASARHTETLGATLAGSLAPGDVVLVSGELGAGKTTFVRGALRALGVREEVTSPTYVVGALYAGTAGPVAHLDLYRLAGLDGEDPGLLDPFFGDGIVTFVEWPERAGSDALAAGGRPVAYRVTLSHGGGDAREVAWS